MTTKVADRIAELRLKLKELQGQLTEPVIAQAVAEAAGDAEAVQRHAVRIRELTAQMSAVSDEMRAAERLEKDRVRLAKERPGTEAWKLKVGAQLDLIKSTALAAAAAVHGWRELERDRPAHQQIAQLAEKFGNRLTLPDPEFGHIRLGNEDGTVCNLFHAISGCDGGSWKNPLEKFDIALSHIGWSKNGKDHK